MGDDPDFYSNNGYACEEYGTILKGKCYDHTVVGVGEVCIHCHCACYDEKKCEERWEEYNKLQDLIEQNSRLEKFLNVDSTWQEKIKLQGIIKQNKWLKDDMWIN